MKIFSIKKILPLAVIVLSFFNYPPVFASSAQGAGWRYTTPQPVISGYVDIARNKYLYSVTAGGTEWAPINPDGSLGSWSWTSGGVPLSDYYGCAGATTATILYITGGSLGLPENPAGDNEVLSAAFNPDGTLGTFISAGPGMQTGRFNHASLIVNGRLYAFGGNTYSGGLNSQFVGLNSVEFAPINTDGTVSTFQYTSSLSRITGQVYLAWNLGTTVFCYGVGYNHQPSTFTYIEKSTVKPDGTLSAWTTIGGPYPFIGPAVVTSRTTLFVLAEPGSNTTGYFQTGITATNGPNPTFQIGSFVPATPPLTNQNTGGLGTWDRFVYLIGGTSAYTVQFYDPDLADTELFPDSAISPFHSINIQQIPMNMEERK